jgi:GntR family transcriptional regulator, rspAB operon transcriptional repressor
MSFSVSKLSHITLDRRIPMRDQIYPVLRDLILTGAIEPGELIDEKNIANQLGISRTPVREAVKKLSDEHLVDVVAQSGTRASRIDAAEINQAHLIRRALEMESAAQAAPFFSQKHAAKLNTILLQHEVAINDMNVVKAIAIDDSFHRFIAEIAKLPRLWTMIEISKAHLDRCRHILQSRSGVGAAVLQQHRAIVEALATQSPDKARDAMREHLESSYGKIENILAEL